MSLGFVASMDIGAVVSWALQEQVSNDVLYFVDTLCVIVLTVIACIDFIVEDVLVTKITIFSVGCGNNLLIRVQRIGIRLEN